MCCVYGLRRTLRHIHKIEYCGVQIEILLASKCLKCLHLSFSVSPFTAMEPNMGRQKANARKRQLVELYDDDNEINRVYRFKVLLPNGTSIGLTVTDPVPEMPFRDFIGFVKDEYSRARKQDESIKQKKHIDWNSDHIYLEDVNSRKMRSMIKFDNFKPHKCHILQLHVSMSCISIHPLFGYLRIVGKERKGNGSARLFGELRKLSHNFC